MSDQSSTLQFPCSNCHKTLQVPSSSIGKKARCPKCQLLSPIVPVAQAIDVPVAVAIKSQSPAPEVKRPTPKPPQRSTTPIVHSSVQNHVPVSLDDHLPPPNLVHLSLPSPNRPAAIPRPATRQGFDYAVDPHALALVRRSKGGRRFPFWAIAAIGVGGVVAAGVVGTGITLSMLGSMNAERIASPPQTSAATAANSPPANSPDRSIVLRAPTTPLPYPVINASTGGKVFFINDPNRSGGTMCMRVYIPPGSHAPKSLPCVFVAPAGTTLLHGTDIGADDNMKELMPFIQAKMMVVCYSIDGWIPNLEPGSPAYMRKLPGAFQELVKARAGVTNGQVAIDRALSSFHEPDPERLYTTGHSSAATLSLLLASQDHRISKCLAFAPVTDLRDRFDGILSDPATVRMLPGIEQYLQDGSPITHVAQVPCKFWVAHARDDDNVPFSETQKYCDALKAQDLDVVFHAQASGGHYGDFLYANIPDGIRWLQSSNNP